MATCDGRFVQQIDSLLVMGEGEAMAPAAWQKLRAHLSGCADCRERYNRISLAERMLHGGPAALETPSPVTLSRIGGAVVANDATLRLPSLPRWAYGLFALGAAAALLPFVLRLRHSESEFTARGQASDLGQQAGIRAFCLANDTVRPLDADPHGAPAHCSANDLLKLTYTNKAGFEELFLVGVDSAWNVKWYEPRPPSAISVPVLRGVDQPIGGAIKLGVNHDPGPVRVFGLFAHAPIAAREVEAAVEELKRTRTAIKDSPSLPLTDRDDVVQRSLLLEVTGSH